MAVAVLKLLEHYIRPWPQELVVGQVVAISGEHVVCQTANGFQFRVALQDVWDGKVIVTDKYHAGRPHGPCRTLTGLRLTEKALLS